MDWRFVTGFPKYSVNPLGQVRNDHTGRILTPQINQFGVPYVGLMGEYIHFNRSLPLLVATAFIPRELKYFDTPINLDWNRMNCDVDNLMWRPRWFAIRYHHQIKEPYENPVNGPVRPVDEEEVYSTSGDASRRYGLLERDVVLSILHQTYAWPTYQMFERVVD